MKYDELPYDMSEDETHDDIVPELDDDEYMEEEITCCRCGRKGPRYEIESHSCAEAA